MNNMVVREFAIMIAEYIGTTMFLFFGFAAAQIANLSGASPLAPDIISTSNLLFIATAFGLSLLTNAWLFSRVSGAIFNPAVSFALVLARVISPTRGLLVSIAQVLGGITAAGMIRALTSAPLDVSNRLGPNISPAQGFFVEMFLTAQLVLVIFMTAVEKHEATFLAPVAIGLTLFIAHLGAIFYTGSSLNPARSFGPDLVIMDFPSYHWLYWFGPLAGALLATGIYKALKWVQYEQFSEDDPDALADDRREIQKDTESMGTNFQGQGEYA